MKLLLVDLDGIAFGWANKPAPRPIGKPFQRLQARTSELLSEQLVSKDLLRLDGGSHEMIAVAALNVRTLQNWAALGVDWPVGVCAAVAAVAEALGARVPPKIEMAIVPRAPEAADAALVALLQNSPWTNDETFQEVIIASKDANLRKEVAELLPIGRRRVSTSGGHDQWSIGHGWVRKGAKARGPALERRVGAEWSAGVSPSMADDLLAEFAHSNRVELVSTAELATQIKSRAHVLTQIGVSDKSVCGVARLAHLLSGSRDHPLFWLGLRDYLELTTSTAVPSGNFGTAGPATAATTGAGTVRFQGAHATVSSNLPAPLWEWLSRQLPETAAFVQRPASAGIAANDAVLRHATAQLNASAWPTLSVKLGKRPLTAAPVPGAQQRSNSGDQLVFYAPSGWWWTAYQSSSGYERTDVASSLLTGVFGLPCDSRPASDAAGLYFAANLPSKAAWQSTTAVAHGRFGWAVDLTGAAKHGVLFLATQDLTAAQPIQLQPLAAVKERALQRQFPSDHDWVARLRRTPVALAAPAMLSETSADSVLN